MFIVFCALKKSKSSSKLTRFSKIKALVFTCIIPVCYQHLNSIPFHANRLYTLQSMDYLPVFHQNGVIIESDENDEVDGTPQLLYGSDLLKKSLEVTPSEQPADTLSVTNSSNIYFFSLIILI